MSWKRTIEQTKGSILAIMVDQSRAFEDDWQNSGQATGFVVDAERGIVLTNRHVVTAGPVVARGIFADLREVELKPLYRDPIHDFGFFWYDPATLRGAVPRSLPLYPEGALEGVEIRVIGNDAGEGFSILSGTLSRLDREAPDYGEGHYSDWNTFYMQAASMTSGGSSGSPVIDEEGRVVGLNAGGHREAAAAYFLPIRRIVRAFEALRRGEPVTRGTVHVRALHRSFDELLRRGVTQATLAESMVAVPRSTGLLVVDRILPTTEAARSLRVGDVIIRVNGELIDSFEPFEDALDSSIGGVISLVVVRDGASLIVDLPVEDLESLVPDEFIEIGEAIFHPLSSVHAWHLNAPPRGVVVAAPGYLLVDEWLQKGALLESVAGTPIRSLDDLAAVFGTLRQGEAFSVRFRHFKQPTTLRQASAVFSSRWFPCRRWRREHASMESGGQRMMNPERWRSETLAAHLEQIPLSSQIVEPIEQGTKPWHRVQSALVHLQFRSPYIIAGWHRYDSPRGTGIVIDKERGLIATDRSTVWHALGDITVTVAGGGEVPARVLYLHPLHNLVLLQCDISALGDAAVGEAELVTEGALIGSDVHLIGVNEYGSMHSKKATITSIRSASTRPPTNSFFQETNLDLIQLNARHADFNGAIVDDEGRVVGFWGIFAHKDDDQFEFTYSGIPAVVLADLRALGRGERVFRWIEAEFAPIRLPELRRLKVPAVWLTKINAAIGTGRRQLLRVVRTVPGGPSEGCLEPGDVILSVYGTIPVDHRSLEELLQREKIEAIVWRDGTAVTVEIAPETLSGEGVNHIVHWAGAVMHAPHAEIRRTHGEGACGVYVASGNYGSPSYRCGLEVGSQIISLNGKSTPDLGTFIAVARQREGTSPIVVRFLENGAIERVVTLIPNPELWPSYELIRDSAGEWRRSEWE